MRLKREPNTKHMKLNQFFAKPVIAKPQATVFQLSNETREAELENRIKELETQLSRLVDQGEENDSLHKQVKESYKERKSLIVDRSQLTEELNQKGLIVTDLTNVKMDLDAAQKQIKTSTLQAEQQQATIEAAQQNSSMLHKNHEELEHKFHEVSRNYGALNIEHNKLKGIASEQNETLRQLSEASEKVKYNYSELVNEKSELNTAYQATLTQLDYWRGIAGNFADRVDEYEKLELQLREWVTALTTQNEQETSKSKGAKVRLQDTQKVISEMGGKIDEMEAEQKYLQEANIELKTKVARPRYASFGTIERLENFTMTPMGAAVNRNKLYLGNAKPTLLKFKSREEKEDDN